MFSILIKRVHENRTHEELGGSSIFLVFTRYSTGGITVKQYGTPGVYSLSLNY